MYIQGQNVTERNGSDSYEFTKVQLFTRISLPFKPASTLRRQPPPADLFYRSVLCTLFAGSNPKGEWLSIRASLYGVVA